ncbi:MAG: ferritin-like domain-containing protein [Actinomycetota bacterium]|nr:ferritin-like domain-containing protein [Actinomycetota bacterium]
MSMTAFDRRVFLKGTAATIPAAAALQLLGGRWAWAQAADFKDDVDVLNFALTLEFLEATFYEQANGMNLVTGVESELFQTIEADEKAHVEALTATIKDLGGKPVAAPKVDFGGAFNSRESFLKLSHTFENTGVQAYLGAAGFIKDTAILTAAASIFGVEARHAAVVGNLLELEVEGGVFMGATETPKTKDQVLKAVMPFVK